MLCVSVFQSPKHCRFSVEQYEEDGHVSQRCSMVGGIGVCGKWSSVFFLCQPGSLTKYVLKKISVFISLVKLNVAELDQESFK